MNKYNKEIKLLKNLIRNFMNIFPSQNKQKNQQKNYKIFLDINFKK